MKHIKPFQTTVLSVASLVIISLLSGCGGGGYEAISGGLFVEPRSATLSPGQTQVFEGSAVEIGVQGFQWEVIEGDGGGTLSDIPIINSDKDLSTQTSATYTAPTTRGTYHLKLILNPEQSNNRSAEATIQVK